MKTRLLLLTLLLLIVGCSKDPVNEISLQTRGGLKYEINQTTPYSGPTFMTHENGQFSSKGNYKDGIKDGSFEEFYDNGQLKKSVLYDGGTESGESVLFSENGDSIFYQNFDNDSSFIKDKLYFTESDYWKVKSIYYVLTNEVRKELDEMVEEDEKYLKSIEDNKFYVYRDFISPYPELDNLDILYNVKLIFYVKSLDVEFINEYGEKDKQTFQYDFNFENSLISVVNDMEFDGGYSPEKFLFKLSKNPDSDSFEFILDLKDFEMTLDPTPIGIIFSNLD